MLKKLMLPSFLLLFALCTGAQEKEERVYEFRFVPQKDMFFIPYGDNHKELERLSSFVAEHKDAIENGRMPLYVDGYCNSMPDEAQNLAIARMRSNRVKSELIVHQELTEKCFVTHNHADKGNWVTVRVQIAAPRESAKIATTAESGKTGKAVAAGQPASSDLQTASPVSSDLQSDVSEYQDFQSASDVSSVSSYPSSHPFSLRANLLRWATLTPDLGLEWRVHRHVSILVNGSWTSWSWDNKSRRYALWKVSPEVRYYLGKQGKGFLGVLYHAGEFHYKLGKTGRQGDYQGGGLTGGYLLDLTRALSLDFHAGLGYTRSEYDQYKVVESTRVRQGSETKNYWGINQLGITLVWKLIK